ncbi:ATP-binding protein [Streptomyces scopuliridis]|uniref:ATP-binding protein n=1 Tax=Streptomyces scopuliridis TaxID=452529 RepID=UPI0036837702
MSRFHPWDRLALVALPTAVGCARVFAKITLRAWGASRILDDALLVTSELMTNAVHATGLDRESKWTDIRAEHVIGVQFRVMHDSLYVEIWDNSPNAPVLKNPRADAVGGRGLQLVNGVARRWGTYRPPTGGKIVWAELPLSALPEPVPDPAPLPHRVPSTLRVPEGPVKDLVDTALTQRVLEGLRKL